jgi:23S rRNA pseudouridine1911/1915/1917 synthase
MTGKAPTAAAAASAAPARSPTPGEQTIAGALGAAAGRLDRALAAAPAVAEARLSRSRIKALILDGRVSLGGRTISDPSHGVKPGQRFAIIVPESRPAIPEAQAIDLDVRFEDDDLIVFDKPAGMVVHPGAGNPDRTLVNALIAHCGDSLRGIGGVRRPGIVHRLDKDTSGLMVAAKTEAAHASLTAQFAARTVERVYVALVWGVPRPRQGEIAGNIGRSRRNRTKMAVLTSGGRPALTRYRVTRTFGDDAVSLLECRLATGRTHQIRVHLAEIGHPVLGDPVYGRTTAARLAALPPAAREALKALGGQALHAYVIGFDHPATGDRLRYESQVPKHFKSLMEKLERL